MLCQNFIPDRILQFFLGFKRNLKQTFTYDTRNRQARKPKIKFTVKYNSIGLQTKNISFWQMLCQNFIPDRILQFFLGFKRNLKQTFTYDTRNRQARKHDMILHTDQGAW